MPVQIQFFGNVLDGADAATPPDEPCEALGVEGVVGKDGFFERRTNVTTRANGSPNTPPTSSSGRKPANRYASSRRFRLRE